MMKFISPQIKYFPVWFVFIFAVSISLLTRIILLFFAASQGGFTALFAGSFIIGFLYDLLSAAFIVIPLLVHISFTNNFIYTPRGRIVTTFIAAGILCTLLLTGIFPKDYSHLLFRLLLCYVIFRIAVYYFLCAMPLSFLQRWRRIVLHAFLFVITGLLLLNAVSELMFWQEFSTRYNFIAVDYLIYTNEILGNIRESYPLPLIITAICFCCGVLSLLYRKKIVSSVASSYSFAKKIRNLVAFLVLLSLTNVCINPQWISFSKNNYANELAGNGIYQFVQAFKNNELDFYKFYQTIPDKTAFQITRNELAGPGIRFTSANTFDIERTITSSLPENKMNVVLITVESLSASFMASFGNTQRLTPGLDSLAAHSLLFTNCYAAGTRTVRGLEALTLSIPPLPGQSIVKRPGEDSLCSLGSVLRAKGYTTQFIYGGFSYFDNMGHFFKNNGYEVIDRSGIQPGSAHFANIWGVADEDLFALSLGVMDADFKKSKHFFTHIMTVSNHRPFTYPEGRIDIPPSAKSREGGVKYTDYAIMDFIKKASRKPWFSNTLFVIIADHCASSAGKQNLPLTGYHIPLMIYSSGLAPKRIETLTGQADVAPTLLGLLHFSYTGRFFGQDILRAGDLKPKASISTYQRLGFLTPDQLVIQSPLKKINVYRPELSSGTALEIPGDDSTIRRAQSFYQVASWMISHKKFRAPARQP